MHKKLSTPQQQAYATKAKHRSEYEKALNKEMAKVAKTLQDENPEFEGFKVKPNNAVYIPSRKDTGKIITALTQGILLDRTNKKTQAAILRDVQTQFPESTLYSSIWYKPLSAGLWKKVETLIVGNMSNPISIRGCKTLSEVYKKIKANRERDAAIKTFKAEIVISKDAVIVGNKTYTTSYRTSNGHKYPCIRVKGRDDKRGWLRVDRLIALLRE